MSLRKIATIENADKSRRAVIYRDAEWGEFRVCFTVNGTYKPKADYHTDDKRDAFDTAQHFANLFA